MFSGSTSTAAPGAVLAAVPGLEDLRDALGRLATLDGAELSEAELIDQLTAMEQLKSALAAAQARVTATLARKRAEAESMSLGNEIGLARQESPVRGRHPGASTATRSR